MGLAIDRERFTAEEFRLFQQRLTDSLVALRELLTRPGFGLGPPSIGAEVEMHLVAADCSPLAANAEVLATAQDPRLTLEINRFNLEINASPSPLAGRPFSRLRKELSDALGVVRAAAAQHGAREAMIGILPTLRVTHLAEGVLSDAARYRALSRTLREIRGEPFSVHIKGRESLSAQCDDVALEGANASFQVHLRVEPADFAACYNAAQLAAAPVLAAAANSPFFDGKCLWDETRIALFQQSVDTRIHARERTRMPSRVAFGHGWVQDAHQLFAENVALHAALLPVMTREDPQVILRQGGVPALEELRLHHGTVWNWNRAVFDPDAGGHLRIEHRLLPSGPTIIDMVANAALTIGLTIGLSEQMSSLVPTFPFAYAEQNVYAAAKYGLEAELLWPTEPAPSPRPRLARELVLELLPIAEAGLLSAGVLESEASQLLDVVRARILSGRTGAAMQRELVEQLEDAGGRDRALSEMLETYLDWSARDIPVHRWLLERQSMYDLTRAFR
jgi:gamma-glutamyl:cysteine ligase YbdK (ATP-grasp superfamily)